MKRILSGIIAVLLIVSLTLSAFAAQSLDEYRSMMKTGFSTDKAARKMDYLYYSPVKGEDDTQKYPLLIYIHGMFYGLAGPGTHVRTSYMPYFIEDSLQAKFEEGGCFLMVPRSATDGIWSTWSKGKVGCLKALIDEFIRENPNVDPNQIYILGSSAGGAMIWNMLTAYPDFWAGAVILSAAKFVSRANVEKAKNIPIWMIGTKDDILINYWIMQRPVWNNIKALNTNPDKCRFSTFSGGVVYPDGTKPFLSHNLAPVVGHELTMADGSPYPNLVTETGTGITIPPEEVGIISWINDMD